jgi:hypothetical protein
MMKSSAAGLLGSLALVSVGYATAACGSAQDGDPNGAVTVAAPVTVGNPLSPIVGYEQINLTESCGSCGSHAGAICLGYFSHDTSVGAVAAIEQDVYSDFGLPCRPGPSDLLSAYNGYLRAKSLPWKAVYFTSSSDVLGYIERGSPVVAHVDMWGGHYVSIYGLTGGTVFFSDGTIGTGLSGSSLPTGNLKKWPWSSFLEHATGEYIGFEQTSAPPRGYLDVAGCAGVGGWTQEESVPTTAIEAEVDYDGPAGGAGTTGFRFLANVSRSDLCTALGSCDHAFTMPWPRSLMDGAAHEVYAYGLNPTAGGPNALLTNAPKTITCTAPAVASGDVKRHITSPTILADWRFDAFVDQAPYTTTELAAIADGVDLGTAPRVVQVAGQSGIYVVDGPYRRHVINPASLAAWRITTADVTPITAAALAALQAGPDWPAVPLLVKDPSSDPVYVLDVQQ